MIIIDVLVVGAGGNGQTYFMKFLKQNKIKTNRLNDKDKLKHKKCPSKIPDRFTIKKCIYLFNEPLSSVKSHFRREWPFNQMKKLGNPFNLKKKYVNTIDSFLKLTEQNNKDLFGIEYQFNNWINTDVKFPILYLNFNDILNKKELLNSFLGKELNYSLFEIKERTENNTVVSNKVKLIYDKLYKYMIKRTNEI